MILTRLLRPSVPLVLAVLVGACDSLDPAQTQFGIIHVPMVAVGDGHTATPSAFFFQGRGVNLSSTDVTFEGCVVQPISNPVPSPSTDFIDAGATVSVSSGATTATLVPNSGAFGVFYELEDGQPIPVSPGDQITISIPGAVGGFPASTMQAPSVEAFTPAAATLPASEAEAMALTWAPVTNIPGTAMFYSLRYDADNSGALDTEIACVFEDDGSGSITAATLDGFRDSEIRTIIAQRALITAERLGSVIVHVTSTLAMPVTLLGG
jgi:hypothetical protein